MLAVPPMSDKYERLFSSCKILLEDRRSRLKIDIIKANKYLRHGYRPPLRVYLIIRTFGKAEGEEQDPQEAELSLKGQAKARLAAAVAAEVAAQGEYAAADEEALAEEEAIKHDCEVEDEGREGGEIENELPNID